ncbi:MULTISPECIES: hypothetical protein [unclassified Mycobacterium]|uniref:hypothetical protein n=1 Tax=unclassified Mycobacterium TaxID=2642494 RepID=UPI0007FF8FCB|nr:MULTISPECIES: hypothetical protein [unclassified Mycobacterium]OBG75828.1 hypothetical protein A5700_23470 [Mycobacterium sp. E1214]OBH31801.1 hypothetical protein A5693_01410 [Mycobacterium sp. E1319]
MDVGDGEMSAVFELLLPRTTNVATSTTTATAAAPATHHDHRLRRGLAGCFPGGKPPAPTG